MKNPLSKYCLALILTALSIYIFGYDYGKCTNNIQIIPFIYKIADPSLFPKDSYVSTVRYFPSVFPYLMAFLSRWVDLETLHFLLYITAKYILLIAAFHLARYLFRSGRTAVISMFLFAMSPLINVNSLLGGDPLMKSAMYQTTFAAPFSLIAINAFLAKKYAATAVLLAFIYYINALIGNFLVLIFLFAFLYAWLYMQDAEDMRKFKNATILLFSLLLPGIIWVIRLAVINGCVPSRDFIVWLRNWHTGHYFPQYWPMLKWVYFIIFTTFFAVFFRKGFKDCRQADTVRSFIWALVTAWAIAFVFGEFFPVRGLIMLQFFRSDIFFIAFGVIFAARYIELLFNGGAIIGIVMSALILFALVEFYTPSYSGWILLLFLLFEYKGNILEWLASVSDKSQMIFKLILGALAVFLIAVAIRDIFIYSEQLRSYCFIVLIAALFLSKGDNKKLYLNGNLMIAALLIFSLVPDANLINYRLAIGKLSNSVEADLDDDFKDAQVWSREHTGPRSMFITPPYISGFRIYSKRPVFVEWVDGAAMHWRSDFGDEWADRLDRLKYSKSMMRQRGWVINGISSVVSEPGRAIYAELDEDDCRGIRKDYGAEFVVTEKPKKLNLPQVYENRSFFIYRITGKGQ